jgi:predicted ATPase
MIARTFRIIFRLTPAEHDQYERLIPALRAENWSDVVRLALKEMYDRAAAEGLIKLSDKLQRASHGEMLMPLFTKRKKLAKKKAAKKRQKVKA